MVAENSSVRRPSGVASRISSKSSRKAHVEHLVGLVEHHADQARQVERAALEMVAKATGRADHDRRAAAQIAAFLARIHPADAGRDAQARARIEPTELAADLQRQFARGGDDQRERFLAQRRAAQFAEQLVGQRDAEGHGLAAAGLRRNDQVAALRFGIDDGGLDGGGCVIAACGQCIADHRRKSFESHGISCLVRRGGAGGTARAHGGAARL